MTVQLVRAVAFDRPWVVATAEVVPLSHTDARAALKHNATLAFGALSVEGDQLVLRFAAPVVTLNPADLERAIVELAHEGARLRRELTVPIPDASALAFLVTD